MTIISCVITTDRFGVQLHDDFASISKQSNKGTFERNLEIPIYVFEEAFEEAMAKVWKKTF